MARASILGGAGAQLARARCTAASRDKGWHTEALQGVQACAFWKPRRLLLTTLRRLVGQAPSLTMQAWPSHHAAVFEETEAI